jgi:hypothetical protein
MADRPDPGPEAARRRDAAADRAQELRERRKRLRAGTPVTADDVVRARASAERAGERARGAARAAVLRHEDAATAHEAAALTAEAAARLDPLHAAELRERAARHRLDAAADRAEALLEPADPPVRD